MFYQLLAIVENNIGVANWALYKINHQFY